MAYNTKAILVDVNGRPIPNFYDNVADVYRPWQGPDANGPLVQDSVNKAVLEDILAKLTADPATQTTLAEILVKLADPATQTTLAAVLAAMTDGTQKVTVNGSIVADRFEGSATVTRTYTGNMNALEICNDGAASLTFTVSSLAGRTFTVLAGDVVSFNFPAFNVVVITTAVAYRCTVFGATAEVGVSS